MADEPILATITGEYFQPVRLHYRILDAEGLLGAFKKLRCVDSDPTRPRFVWLYDHEAKKLRLKQSYAQLPEHLRPIVIGSIFLREPDQLILDLRSCERALLAIPFFDKHIPRTAASLAEAEVVNKLFPATGNAKLTPDGIFDHQGSARIDPDAAVRRIAELVADVQDPEEKFRIALEDMDARAKQPLPEIERLPVYYYEEGIQGFELSLRTRQIVAMQHWLGHPEYSLFDALQSLLK
ncbi:MAG TPA: hypothetical protein VG013_09025 [Gemmataceae bacterium]|jgi:hypothetical protein|nr:hypothetical protein [Gemmataceae bacterium]